MSISKELGQEYMDLFVGTPEAITTFEDDIKRRAGGFPSQIDPYDILREASSDSMTARVHDHMKTHSISFPETAVWEGIIGNGHAGTTFASAVTRAVGETCQELAKVPQQQAVVERNLNTVMRYGHSMAFSGSFVAQLNIEAAKIGADPRSRLQLPRIVLARFLDPDIIDVNLKGGIRATIDEATGQIAIVPRYRLRKSTNGRHCPVAHTTTEAGKSNSALLTFMNSIGNVAMAEILPRQFPITQ